MNYHLQKVFMQMMIKLMTLLNYYYNKWMNGNEFNDNEYSEW